jgi:hypothetical protein
MKLLSFKEFAIYTPKSEWKRRKSNKKAKKQEIPNMMKFVAFPCSFRNVLLMLLRKNLLFVANAHFYCECFSSSKGQKAHKSLEYLMEMYRFFSMLSLPLKIKHLGDEINSN